ncbi:MAG: hypothetical protein Q9170_007381 [Blastenia crenularia]
MHERNGDLAQERATAAVQNALDNMNSKKRKRDLEAGGPQSAPKRASSSSMNGTNHQSNIYMDNLQHSSSSNDFSHLSQQLRAATHGPHSISDTTVSSTAAAALAAGIIPQMTLPQQTDISFASTASNTDADRHFESSFDMSGDSGHGHNGQGSTYNLHSFPGNTAAQAQAAREGSNGGHKPSVGSDEWHKVRRDNHKEVERRRRETINEGINEIAKIVPGCEKNKGSILQRAVEYIAQLKLNEERAVEKLTQEKMLIEGVVNELTASVDNLKSELDRTASEAAMWKKIAVDAGLEGNGRNGAADAEAEDQQEGSS